MIEDESQNFVGRVAQKAIIERDGMILLMRNLGRSTWEIPGGRLHVQEQPAPGLAREIREEFQIDIEVIAPVYTGTFVLGRTQEPHFLVVYACKAMGSADLHIAADEVEEAKWFSREDIAGLEIWKEYKEAIEAYFSRQ
jgi:ADP-ribose pyrophosphatase YjhB (NUDIX family)